MKRGKKELLSLFILLFLLNIFSANINVTTSQGSSMYLVKEDIKFIYNLSIKNTGGDTGNIKTIEISLPVNFTFLNFSGTNSDYDNFSFLNSKLKWTNSNGTLIELEKTKNFWFEAKSNSIGFNKLTISALDSSKWTFAFIYSKIIPLTANDNITLDNLTSSNNSCIQNWECTDWNECLNGKQNRICADLNECNDKTNMPAETKVCNLNECFTKWECTPWEECIENEQTRRCIDKNSCNDETDKPEEIRICGNNKDNCVPQWECNEWDKEFCSKEKIMTRICTDSNNCNNEEKRPSEKSSCEEIKNYNILFIMLVIIVIILVGGISWVVIKKLKE